MTFVSHQLARVVIGDLHKSGKQLPAIFVPGLPEDGHRNLRRLLHIHLFQVRPLLHGFLEALVNEA